MGPMAAKHQQQLKLEIPESLPVIEGDPERIRQIITNLLTNSLKFTQSGGEITLRGTFDERNVTIEVLENGPGLTKGEVERLFQPYFRKESDREHLSGLGLGLALCKTLVELHGRKIWAKSQEGTGSTFTFTLPRKTSSPPKESVYSAKIP
jgi:signal transduction histidine kinase